ncbi:30S ribosomal protein S12-B, chloroplastic [Quillaja saponaria]|uniref:30S ribosomal protein S12-B, chloroplastic n=1 Tax=Quillaja saponaria TaxID=32244 RepID=A0AAD7P4T2_QUISA|nr:30S ribosomal protein S12-B, chloroplastic [Quillaja saponaria]
MLIPQIPSLLLLREKKFTTRRPSTSTRHCSVRLSPIAENSPLLPPVGVWAISLQHNIGRRKDLEDPPKHESRDLSENGFLFEECITAWISSH